MAATNGKNSTEELPPRVWAKIETAVRGISYGSITIVVQDEKVIQIEINEKIKLA